MPATAARQSFFHEAGRPVPTLRGSAAFRTLFTTEHASDAEDAGFDYACEPGTDGGFAVHFDGRHSIPSVILNGSDGQIEISGWRAISELCSALMKADAMARRMSGAS